MPHESPLATTLDDTKPAPRPARMFSGITCEGKDSVSTGLFTYPVLMSAELAPRRTKREQLSNHRVRQARGDSAAKALKIAEETMKDARAAMGLGSLAT